MKIISHLLMLDKIKIYIVDFEDSFTFNIAAELYNVEKNLIVIPHLSFFSDANFTSFIQNANSPVAIILGPGPGNPKEFEHYSNKIKSLIIHEKIYLMGICLGHQLVSLIDGFKIRASLMPMHGQQVHVLFDEKLIWVQRYNSLAVFACDNSSDEILIREWKRGISYQFHPESVGTEMKLLFFKDLLHFIL